MTADKPVSTAAPDRAPKPATPASISSSSSGSSYHSYHSQQWQWTSHPFWPVQYDFAVSQYHAGPGSKDASTKHVAYSYNRTAARHAGERVRSASVSTMESTTSNSSTIATASSCSAGKVAKVHFREFYWMDNGVPQVTTRAQLVAAFDALVTQFETAFYLLDRLYAALDAVDTAASHAVASSLEVHPARTRVMETIRDVAKAIPGTQLVAARYGQHLAMLADMERVGLLPCFTAWKTAVVSAEYIAKPKTPLPPTTPSIPIPTATLTLTSPSMSTLSSTSSCCSSAASTPPMCRDRSASPGSPAMPRTPPTPRSQPPTHEASSASSIRTKPRTPQPPVPFEMEFPFWAPQKPKQPKQPKQPKLPKLPKLPKRDPDTSSRAGLASFASITNLAGRARLSRSTRSVSAEIEPPGPVDAQAPPGDGAAACAVVPSAAAATSGLPTVDVSDYILRVTRIIEERGAPVNPVTAAFAREAHAAAMELDRARRRVEAEGPSVDADAEGNSTRLPPFRLDLGLGLGLGLGGAGGDLAVQALPRAEGSSQPRHMATSGPVVTSAPAPAPAPAPVPALPRPLPTTPPVPASPLVRRPSVRSKTLGCIHENPADACVGKAM